MTLRLRLWKDGNPDSATEHPFEQDAVGIGRDPSNALALERPNVSKNHARIEQLAEGLFLTDLKSRNGTYLNGARIQPEDPRPLSPGDRVRICDYIVEVVAWDRPEFRSAAPESSAPEETLQEQTGAAGAEEPVTAREEQPSPQPVAGDSRVAAEYEERLAAAEQESLRLRGEIGEFERKLAEAMAGPPPEVEARRAEEAHRLAAAEEECGRLKVEMAALEEKTNRLLAAENECVRLKAEVGSLQEKLAAVPPSPPPVGQVEESTALARLKALAEAVLYPLLKIMRGRIHFRAEFTGATMFQDPEMEALSKQTPEECMRYLLDPNLGEEKARDRLELLVLETREMIPHVIGLLDGYRKSVDVGTKNMLQQLNPVRLREEMSKKPVRVGPLSIPHKFLPLIADRIAWKAIVQRHRDLQEEDRGILEQRFFRPGFIQGYISCITSAKHEPLSSRPTTSTGMKAKP